MNRTLRELGITVPAWIRRELRASDVDALVRGHHKGDEFPPWIKDSAAEVMATHGDEVWRFIEKRVGVSPMAHVQIVASWAALLHYLVGLAVELWALSVKERVWEAAGRSRPGVLPMEGDGGVEERGEA